MKKIKKIFEEYKIEYIFPYALVITRLRVQYLQYFPIFSYFGNLF